MSTMPAFPPSPTRGEVWVAILDPTQGHEQGGRRPVVVISSDAFNQSAAGLVVVIPMTTVNKRIPLHVTISAPEGGVRRTSYIKCEDVRSISVGRLVDRWGRVSPQTIAQLEHRLQMLLEL